MGNIPTPHIKATEGQIAKTVLMPGDPLRAKFIAEKYLSDVVCFNEVRNMLGFTGNYKGKKVSVMGSGMGMPSIGIYSYELFNFYGVDNIIRIGSAGALADEVKLRDIIIAMTASTNSNYASQFKMPGTYAPCASFHLLRKAVAKAEAMNLRAVVGNVLSSDTFYDDNVDANDLWKRMGILAIEMETAALYMNAARSGNEALCICTISDSLVHGTACSAEQRQTSFTNMMEIAFDII